MEKYRVGGIFARDEWAMLSLIMRCTHHQSQSVLKGTRSSEIEGGYIYTVHFAYSQFSSI